MIFSHPQEPFLTTDFVSILRKHAKVTYIKGVPTIGGKTFFWSTKTYPDIKKQYVIGPPNNYSHKHFYLMPPLPYAEIRMRYHKHFKNQLRKAQTLKLQFAGPIPIAPDTIQECYRIYDANMLRIGTFSFSYQFFEDVITLPYAETYVVSAGTHIVAFGIMLGNLLFIQSSTDGGRAYCANNLFYDRIFQTFQEHPVFMGMSSESNYGLSHFKKEAGLLPIPAEETFFDFTRHAPTFLRHNKLVGWVMRKINSRIALAYLLPY